MKNKLKSINNIPFLVCLAILLLNDFYLKTEYHNWLTGKLSDFCGLFIFASFWTALFPNKKRIVYFSTALIFVIWKSPYSQSFIDFFSYNLYPIHRIVDITDLIALLILPISYLYNQENSLKLKLSPIPLAFLTIVSFCATSIPEPTQTFEQPQYILFKSGNLNFENNNYWNDYKVHKLDSLVIIEIKEIRIGKKAVLDDEFHKAQILKELDLYLLRELKEEYRSPSKISSYNELKGSLIVSKKTSITLKLDSHTDYLNFKETRLDGDFKRLSNDNQLLINGHFKNGIEDSVWTFYNSKNEIVSMKYFKKGELIKIDKFDNSKLLSEKTHNTRSETIRYKYFHLALICLFIIALLTKLVLNYKKSEQKDIPHLSHFSKIAAAIGLPLIVLFLAKMISSIIPNSFSTFFISFFLEIIMAYIIAVPLFLIVFYILRLRSKFDLVFYILLFSLTLVLMEEWIYLKNIINEMPT